MAGIRTYQEFVETFIESGLPVPRVPAHVIPRVRGGHGWLTTRDVDLGIMAGYDPTMERRSASLYLDTDEPDYFVSGGRGNGYSDYWGFVLRAGGMFCAVQHTISSSVGNDPDPRKERINRGRPFAAYNTELAHFADRGPKPLSIAVLYSSFRGYSLILCSNPTWCEADAEPPRLGNWIGSERWRIAMSLTEPTSRQRAKRRLARGSYDGWPELRAAVTFLLACHADQ